MAEKKPENVRAFEPETFVVSVIISILSANYLYGRHNRSYLHNLQHPPLFGLPMAAAIR